MSDDVLADVLLRGHAWEARARVVELTEPVPDRAWRLLDAHGVASDDPDRSTTHVARLVVHRVKVAVPGWTGTWGRAGETVEVDVLVAPGRVRGGAAPRQDLDLVAGRVPLVGLTPPTNVAGFAELLGLDRVTGDGAVDVDGVVVDGSRRLPWMRRDDDALTAPFAVRVEGPTISVGPALDRLAPEGRAPWVASWAQLGRDLDSSAGGATGLAWTELRVTNPREVPDLTFVIERAPAGRVERLLLAGGALTLTVSDAARRAGGGGQRAALTLVPSLITFTADGGRTTIAVADGDTSTTVGSTLVLTASRGDADTWADESAALTGRFRPDPVALAASLRRQGSRHDPLPVFTVLDDGWLETATPDLREQDYVDGARAAREAGDAAAESALAVHTTDVPTVGVGAVVWGNDDPEQRQAAPAATPWGLAVVGVAAFEGTWTIEPAEAPAVLRRVELRLHDVAATLDGAWSIARTPPAPGVLLPALDDWTGAVGPVALHCGAALPNRRPSPLVLDVAMGFVPRRTAAGRLAAGTRATSTVVAHGQDDAVLTALGRTLPEGRAWLRHPTLPSIANMPMTRTALVDPTPSPHRELLPFRRTTTDDPWRVAAAVETTWGTLVRDALRPDPAWVERGHLEQVLLSLPGAALRPRPASADGPGGTARWFDLVYRHDLPFLDEVAATATVDERDTDDHGRPTSAEGLWDVLEERARLAALVGADAVVVGPVEADAVLDATADVTAGRAATTMAARVVADLSRFPGGLGIGEPDAASPPALGGDDRSAGVTLPGGVIEGSIPLALDVADDGTARLLDQQGVRRAASADAVAGVVTTDVSDGDGPGWTSTSLQVPQRLTGADSPWDLWFRGLPMRRAVDGSGDLAFDVADVPSWAAHEWRLRPFGDDAGRRGLRLGGLDVHPLRLERVELAGGTLREAVVRVRLQAPSGGPAHRPELDAVALLTFGPDEERGGHVPRLTEVRGAHDRGGVLDLRGRSGVEARATWGRIELVADGDDVALLLHPVDVAFHLFDVEWSVRIGTVTLPITDPPAFVRQHVAFERPSDSRLWSAGLGLELGLAPEDADDRLWLDVALELGSRDVEASLTVDLLVEEIGRADGDRQGVTVDAVTWFGGRLRAGVEATTAGAGSVQVAWTDASAVDVANPPALLPGFPLDEETPRPGVLSVVFEPRSAGPGVVTAPPDFRVLAAHAELLLGATAILASGGTDRSVTGTDRVHASFLGRLVEDRWSSTLTLDGVVTATSAIAHSGEVAGADDLFPSDGEVGRRLVVHHARLLFDQHELTGLRRLDGSDGSHRPTLFALGGGLAFTMVVEHVLEGLVVGGDGTVRRLGDHRFSVPQVVHLWRPADAVADLERRRTPDGARLGGMVGEPLRDAALAAFGGLAPDTLVVAADVSAFVATAGGDAPARARLRALPTGVQQVARVALEELLDVGASRPGWTHVALPFLSCTGVAETDLGAVLLAPPTDPAAPPVEGDGDEARLAWALRGPASPEDPPRVPLPVDHDVRDVVTVPERRLVAGWRVLAEAPLGPSARALTPGTGTPGGLAPVTAVRPDAIGRTGHPTVLAQALEHDPGREPAERGRRLADVAFADPGWVGATPPALVDVTFAGVVASAGTIETEVATKPHQVWSLDEAGLTAAQRGTLSSGARARLRPADPGRALGPTIGTAAVTGGGVTVVVRCTPAMSGPRKGRHVLTASTRDGLSVFSITQVGRGLEVRRIAIDGRTREAVLLTTQADGALLEKGRTVEIGVSLGPGTEAIVVDGRPVPFTRSTERTDGTWRRLVGDLVEHDGARVELSLGNRADGDDQVWTGTYHRVTVVDAATDPASLDGATTGDLPWLAAGLRAVRALGGFRDASAGVSHHLAAAHVPADRERPPLVVPSPFVTFGLVEPDRTDDRPQHDEETAGEDAGAGDDAAAVAHVAAVVAELVADPDGVLRPIASRLWMPEDGVQPTADILGWATGVRRREAATAPRALVRLRQVVDDGSATAFSFLLLAPTTGAARLGWRARPLRAEAPLEVAEIAHVDDDIPRAVLPVDVAAPLVVAAQSVRDHVGGAAGAGLAALRVTTAHTAAAGASRPGEHVWQGVSLTALLATPVRETTAEPDDFVTPPRAVLARVAARPPLPELPLPGGRPVALDEVTTMHTGIRPGALVEVRAVRQRQHPGGDVVADSVPVVLRSPRPLPLTDAPPGDAASMRPVALVGGSLRSVAASTEPTDVAVFDATTGALEVSLVSPPRGTLPADWNRPLVVSCRSSQDGPTWSVRVRLAGQDEPLVVETVFPGGERSASASEADASEADASEADASEPRVPAAVASEPSVPADDGSEPSVPADDAPPTSELTVTWEDVAASVAATRPGDVLELVVEVQPSDRSLGDPRRLRLPLRVVAADAPPSVLEPRFLRFGDPEHDRRIAGAVARVAAGEDALALVGLDELQLSASRTSVAAGEEIIVGLQRRAGGPAPLPDVTVGLHVDDPSRDQVTAFELDGGVDVEWSPRGAGAAARTVFRLRLPTGLTTRQRVRFVATVSRTSPATGQERVELELPVVDRQPPPGPAAAYAVLRADRATPGRVACPLYALRPIATRTELVDPRDVFADIMRQRAVFHWVDVVRAGSDVAYGLQKISSRGETHVPDPMGST